MVFARRDFLFKLPLAAFVMPVCFRSALAMDAIAGHISRIAGTVVALRDGVETTLARDHKVEIGDTIRTAQDSRVEVTFTDGSVLTIGPDSEVAVSFFAPEASDSTALLDLVSGIVRVVVNKATGWGRFDVRTSTAVASVRGTEYLVEATADKTAVFVAEGRVAVSSRVGAGTVILRMGQGVDITSEYKEPAAKFWGAKRRDEALARVTFP